MKRLTQPDKTATAKILSGMDSEISALGEKLVKAGMMSVLLGGR
jgi:hypothetical protein